MPASYFLMIVTSFSLVHAIINPEWYTCLEFVSVTIAFVAYSIIGLSQNKGPTQDDFEQMKKVIGELATQIKQTNTKVTGLRISKGLQD